MHVRSFYYLHSLGIGFPYECTSADVLTFPGKYLLLRFIAGHMDQFSEVTMMLRGDELPEHWLIDCVRISLPLCTVVVQELTLPAVQSVASCCSRRHARRLRTHGENT